MFFQQIRRFSLFSLLFLLLLTVASLIFVYLVSPLRDPTFQPNSANGGSLVPWLKSVKESDWLFWSSILAFLLSSNITVVIWQPKLSNSNNRIFYFLIMIMSDVVLFGFFYYTFLIYLLTQWLID
ncbi:hypothetical protein [Anabaena azotica]|uniref:Uncharacterized protein n=1 Tax=Anabaena azotica FACHB-119 TaxID=947527 RepID=A0ABR8D7N8_9NOST|nr:hypothetical protein [Anabaena azotica]MBD2502146.1 hypothetical protein [Anabaena azotica FACHB-119]